MEQLKSYDVFISHTWSNLLAYNVIVELLNREPNFYWRNYSFPEYDTVINPNSNAGKKRLTEELEGQIQHAEVVIIVADMFTTNQFWIEKEIEIANSYNIPIILVKSDDIATIPNLVKYQANEVVAEDVTLIIAAIKKLTS